MVFVKSTSKDLQLLSTNPLKAIIYKGKKYKWYAQLDEKTRAMNLAMKTKNGRTDIQTLVVEFGDFKVPGRYGCYLRKERVK